MQEAPIDEALSLTDQIRQDRAQRMQACNEAIMRACETFRCNLRTRVNVTEDGRTVGELQIIALD